ncbi:MAG: hypothetical protein ABI790_16805 [Betaproteobacteria bacterium]
MQILATQGSRNPQHFLAHRPMLHAQRQRPAVVCTRCTAFSFKFSAFDQPCERVTHGRACTGVLTSLQAGNAWQPCNACHGSGWHTGMVCMHCQSLGWRLSRKHS